MKSDRIALIAGIASLGLITAAVPQSHAQRSAGVTAQVPAAPIVVKPNDPPTSKVGTVLLLSGQ
jgi:hypothetical protein